MEKRINLLEDEDNDLLNSRNSEKHHWRSEDNLKQQINNEYQGYNNLDKKLDSVDEEPNS